MRLFFILLAGSLSLGCNRVTGDDEGFIPLFNGKDFSGWMGATDQYRVKDGVIVLPEGRSGKLLTEK